MNDDPTPSYAQRTDHRKAAGRWHGQAAPRVGATPPMSLKEQLRAFLGYSVVRTAVWWTLSAYVVLMIVSVIVPSRIVYLYAGSIKGCRSLTLIVDTGWLKVKYTNDYGVQLALDRASAISYPKLEHALLEVDTPKSEIKWIAVLGQRLWWRGNETDRTQWGVAVPAFSLLIVPICYLTLKSRRCLLRRLRVHRGLCPYCGYPRNGLVGAGRCPECGKQISVTEHGTNSVSSSDAPTTGEDR